MRTTTLLIISLVAAASGVALGFHIDRQLVYDIQAYDLQQPSSADLALSSTFVVHGVVAAVDSQNGNFILQTYSPYDGTSLSLLLSATDTANLAQGTPLRVVIMRQSGPLQIYKYAVATN